MSYTVCRRIPTFPGRIVSMLAIQIGGPATAKLDAMRNMRNDPQPDSKCGRLTVMVGGMRGRIS